jgi:short-subunit dehydrogenase
MKKVLITGATSGIGRELALQYAALGHRVALVGRREEKLVALKEEIGDLAYIHPLDVTDFNEAQRVYQHLIDEMGGMDIMILNAGVGIAKMLPPWRADKNTIEVNVVAFAHGAHFAFDYFTKQGHGQIVGMSSLAAHLAIGSAAAYTASKHFISNYMIGFRQKAKHVDADIHITDVRPGFVKSEMTARGRNMFWVAETDKAVQQMIKAIQNKRKVVYITKRWRLVALLVKCVPQFVWDRI